MSRSNSDGCREMRRASDWLHVGASWCRSVPAFWGALGTVSWTCYWDGFQRCRRGSGHRHSLRRSVGGLPVQECLRRRHVMVDHRLVDVDAGRLQFTTGTSPLEAQDRKPLLSGDGGHLGSPEVTGVPIGVEYPGIGSSTCPRTSPRALRDSPWVPSRRRSPETAPAPSRLRRRYSTSPGESGH